MEILRTFIHYGLHFVLPIFIALRWKGESFVKTYSILVLTMLVDLDHLLATPMFDPCRCSIGFHPLHTWPAMLVYVAMLFYRPTRLWGVGLVLHMFTDCQDCLWPR